MEGITKTAPALTLRGLGKVYESRSGKVEALRDVNLTVPAGSIHGIVGPSGAGKSTLIRCVSGLESATDGQVLVADAPIERQSDLVKAREQIGMVFQHANLLDSRTVWGNIAYPLKLAGVPRKERDERTAELIRLVGLEGREKAYPSELSGGQKQRVGIARGLACKPALLLCDEPTSALDGETTRQILQLLRHLRDEVGVTVVIITHEMAVVRQICDSVSLISGGTIAQTGLISEVAGDFSGPLADELVPFPKPGEVPDDKGVLDVRFTSNPGKPTGSAVLSKLSGLGADIAAGTFETIGQTQVGRLAVTVDVVYLAAARARLAEAGIESREVAL